jgi:hypothetical protein
LEREDAMPGGRFDDQLIINNHGCLTPAGPLDLAAGETVRRLDVWIFQGGGACMAVLRDISGIRWAVTTDPDENHVGAEFQPGLAVAMGLMVTEKAGEPGEPKITKTFQWSEVIQLSK